MFYIEMLPRFWFYKHGLLNKSCTTDFYTIAAGYRPAAKLIWKGGKTS